MKISYILFSFPIQKYENKLNFPKQKYENKLNFLRINAFLHLEIENFHFVLIYAFLFRNMKISKNFYGLMLFLFVPMKLSYMLFSFKLFSFEILKFSNVLCFFCLEISKITFCSDLYIFM